MSHPKLVAFPAGSDLRPHGVAKQRPLDAIIPPVLAAEISRHIPPLDPEPFMCPVVCGKFELIARHDLGEPVTGLTHSGKTLRHRTTCPNQPKDQNPKTAPPPFLLAKILPARSAPGPATLTPTAHWQTPPASHLVPPATAATQAPAPKSPPSPEPVPRLQPIELDKETLAVASQTPRH